MLSMLMHTVKSPESLGSHLASLLSEAEHRVQELGGSTSGSGTSLLEPPGSHRASFSAQHNNFTACGGSAEDKHLALWERRARALRKMLLGFDQARELMNQDLQIYKFTVFELYSLIYFLTIYLYADKLDLCFANMSVLYIFYILGPPDMPSLVEVDVTGTTTVTIRFQEPDSHDSSICTKFKVQWSLQDDFLVVCDEKEVLDVKQRECRIESLIQGQKYYFRAAAGNLKGYSRFRNSTPANVTPSSECSPLYSMLLQQRKLGDFIYLFSFSFYIY